MNYFYLILAIILALALVLSFYVKQEGFISVKSDIPNGEGLSKRYLLHTLRLFNENVKNIKIVKKSAMNSFENTAILKINGKERGKVSDVMNNMLKNVDYINFTMRSPHYRRRRNRRNRRYRR
jgi:hypothetical protein